MSSATASVEVTCAASDVFACLSDLANEEKWRDGVTEVTLKEGNPPEVGSRYTERVARMGMTMDLEIEVTEWVPDRRFAYRFSSSGPFEGLISYDVTSNSEKCIVRSTVDLGGGIMAKAMVPLMRTVVEKDLQQLKILLES